MGWHMKLVICVHLAYVSVCLTREMSVVREWTSLDVQLPPGDGQESRRSILPSDVSSWVMYKDRVFVVLRRRTDYRPYLLTYLDLTDNSTSALLRPYSSYENQQILYYPDIVRVDRCDRMWVNSIIYEWGKYNMIVFDLKTGSILRNIFIPVLHYSYDMTVDDFDCDNEYVYISNDGAVWTYSWAEDDSWRHISEHITSMIVAPNNTVYHNERYSPMVYYMSTTHLRDRSNKMSDITELGRSRKLNVHLYSSALDAKSDILYYPNYDNRPVIHAVPCWTSERCSSNCQDVSIDPTHELRYITVDENGYLWAITSRVSIFEDGKINFRLLSVPVKSTCVESNAEDTTNTITDVESNAEDTTNTNTDVESNAEDTTNASTDVESNAEDTTNTSTDVESNAEDTTNTSTDVESNAEDTTNTSTDVESNAEDTTDTSTDVEPNAKDTTDTANIHEITTAASSTTEQTSTLGSVPKHTTVNIADTTAGTPNSNITQAVGGTNMPYLLFSFTNTTIFNFNLSNFTIRY